MPTHFEVSFGGAQDELGPLRLSADVAVAGRIDRIDVGQAAARRSSTTTRAAPRRTARTGSTSASGRSRCISSPCASCSTCEPAGGLYQPLGSRDLRPRGALLDDADPGLDVVGRDRRDADEIEQLVDEVVAQVLEAVSELRAGRLRPRPATCAYGGGCSYPMICRSEA